MQNDGFLIRYFQQLCCKNYIVKWTMVCLLSEAKGEGTRDVPRDLYKQHCGIDIGTVSLPPQEAM